MGQLNPLISILIPTWNRVQSVLTAVESIGPIGNDTEVVIVDNASGDGVFQELQRHFAGLSGVRLFRNEQNLGMVKNWNRCLELARGEWLGLLCSDDRYRPCAIQRLREDIGAAMQEPALIIQDPTSDAAITISLPGSETVRTLRLPIASGNFWHRRVYEQIGGFDERFEYSADAEYWYRAAFSFPVVKVREPFAVYVAHEDNYMWATWQRPDYLQQTELLARTVSGYIFSASSDKSNLVEARVVESIWQTLLTIIACTFLIQGKNDIFQKYFPEALRKADTLGRKKQLLKALTGAILKKCFKAVADRER